MYQPIFPPEEFDAEFLYRELLRISDNLAYLETTRVRIVPSANEPARRREGDIANADGTNWDPGGGAGLYQYLSGAWVKL